MSEINPLGSSFYFSGLQNAANRAAKNEKKEKISSSKVKFSDILKKSEVSEFELQGFPSEIANLSVEDAALYLKDQVDLLGDKFAETQSPESIIEFKNAVQQFVRFVVLNNFEVTKLLTTKILTYVKYAAVFNACSYPIQNARGWRYVEASP